MLSVNGDEKIQLLSLIGGFVEASDMIKKENMRTNNNN